MNDYFKSLDTILRDHDGQTYAVAVACFHAANALADEENQ